MIKKLSLLSIILVFLFTPLANSGNVVVMLGVGSGGSGIAWDSSSNSSGADQTNVQYIRWTHTTGGGSNRFLVVTAGGSTITTAEITGAVYGDDDSTCDTYTSTTVTMDDNSGLSVDDAVAGPGIPPATTITYVDPGGTEITISNAATATAENVTLTFGVALTNVWDISAAPTPTYANTGWRLTAPATGAHSIVVTATEVESTLMGIARSYTGVHQTTPIGTPNTYTGYTAAPSLTVTASSGDLVVDAIFVADQDPTPDGSQTQRTGEYIFETPRYLEVSEEAATGNTDMDWTNASSAWTAHAGVAIKPAP